MKQFLAFLCCMATWNSFAQVYRIGYDSGSIPELYNQTTVFVEEQIGNSFKPVPKNRYKLSTNDAKLDGNFLTYNRTTLYRNNGELTFILTVNKKAIPLTLNLPVLKDIRYNLYTDSIKPILNYYLNIEGEFSNGKIFPMDTSFVTVTSDVGSMKGLEWILPKQHNFEKVTFTATNKFDPKISKSITIYLKKYKDPRDDPNYQDRDEQNIIDDHRKKRRR